MELPEKIAGWCDACCQRCLYWWSGRCPHGGCFDDYMATTFPRERLTGKHRTGWENCECPGEQDHWCRSGRYINIDVELVCPDFVQYEGQTIKECLYAPVSVFQDGYISCNLCDTVGCEWCYSQWEQEDEQ